MAAHIVKCKFCGTSFDANKEPFVKIKTRYAHELCAQRAEAAEEKDKSDYSKLLDYIQELFQYETVPRVIHQQINQFVKEYDYTHSGILKSLVYFYEIKHGDKSKANGRISIVPYVYDEAKRYYFALWEAQQNAEQSVVIQVEKPPEKEIRICPPRRQPVARRRNLFAFLDKESD